jgi:hypothetical protein
MQPWHLHKTTFIHFLILLRSTYLPLDSCLCDHSYPEFDLFKFIKHLKSLPRIRSCFSLIVFTIAYFFCTIVFPIVSNRNSLLNTQMSFNHLHWTYNQFWNQLWRRYKKVASMQ